MIDDVRTLPSGKLRISSPLNFAQVILEPALTAFMKEYPNVDVVLEISNRATALTAEGYDFAMYIGPEIRFFHTGCCPRTSCMPCITRDAVYRLPPGP